MKSDRQTILQHYTGLIAFIGSAILLLALLHPPQDISGLAVFCGLAVAAELLSVELYITTRRSRVSVSAIISIAVIMIYGAWSAALLGAVVGITTIYTTSRKVQRHSPEQRAPWQRRSMFNLGMMVISNTAAGGIYSLAGGAVGNPIGIGNLIPLLAAVFTNEVINISILLVVLHIQTGKTILHLWKQNFAWVVPVSLISGVIGGWALAGAYYLNHTLGLLVFILPIATTSYSIRLYVDHTKKYVGRLEALNKSLDDANVGLLETLGAVIDAYDVFTYGHSAQVAVYVDAISSQMEISEDQKAIFVKAALVHDIGKVGVTDQIIGKPGPLSDDEYNLVQRHPIIGANILRRMNGLKELVPLVRHHHEHWDGSGYPAGLAGDEIPLGARVIAIADAVDAMFSARPYRSVTSIADIRAEVLRCSGTQFDPKVVAAFLSVMDTKDAGFFADSGMSILPNTFESSPVGIDNRCLKRSVLVE